MIKTYWVCRDTGVYQTDLCANVSTDYFSCLRVKSTCPTKGLLVSCTMSQFPICAVAS